MSALPRDARIVLTGAAGLVGQNLLVELEAQGYSNLVAIDKHAYNLGILRGLHFQNPDQQGKLVYVLEGEVFDVAVDIRVGSPTFGEWEAVVLSSENKRQFYVPEGFAHGFLVTGDKALFAYKVTGKYNPSAEGYVLWNDPEIGIEWPVEAPPTLSEKDRAAPPLAEIPTERLPRYKP